MTSTHETPGERSATRRSYHHDNPRAVALEIVETFEKRHRRAFKQADITALASHAYHIATDNADLARASIVRAFEVEFSDLMQQRKRDKRPPMTAEQRKAAKLAGEALTLSMLTLAGVSLLGKTYRDHTAADLRKNGRKSHALARRIPKGKVVADVFKTDAELQAAVR